MKRIRVLLYNIRTLFIIISIIMLLFVVIGQIQLQNSIIENSDRNYEGIIKSLYQSSKNFDEIKKLQKTTENSIININNKVNELFFMKNASEPTTNTFNPSN